MTDTPETPETEPEIPATEVAETAPDAAERIAKVIARSGVASRRDAEKMILAGRVSVNGKAISSPALDVMPGDKVVVDGKPLDTPQETRLWLYYKPLGLVTTEKDEQGRRTIFDEMPEGMPRVMNVGRLDLNSEGLLLLTNDGGLKRRLELPETAWLRKYRVRVNGRPSTETFDPLRRGITIDGEEFQPMEITLDRQQGANAWLTLGLREGRNREIRRAMAEIGLTVNRLIRVSYGPFRLNEMQPGDVLEVKRKVLRDQLGDKLLTGAEDGRPPLSERKPRVVRGEKGAGRPERSFGDKPFGRRPEGRDDEAPRKGFGRQRDFSAGGDAKKGERPFRSRDDAPRREGFTPRDGEAKPRFGAKPRSEGNDRGPKRFGSDRFEGKRPEGGERPYKDRRDGDRPEGKRFGAKPRSEGFRSHGDDRAPRRFEGGDRPERSERPRRDEDGKRPFEKRPFERNDNRGAEGERSFRKPYAKRPEGEGERPRRPREEGDRPRGSGFGKPGSFKSEGFRSHGGAGKPRAAGFKSHAAGAAPREGERSERPQGAKSYGDKPRGDRPYSDKPRSDRSYGDKPRGDRPFSDKPRGERSFGDKPRGDRPYSDKPRGDRPFSDKPRGERSFGDKPRGDRPFNKGPANKGSFGKGSFSKGPGTGPRGGAPKRGPKKD
ncbi:pseudouridine synthase [Paenirhodobacter enshiensis]|uniref:pseudouridine synthase n=1 Tax=Paenirhodobacter enshiensis TaxID=1105367 RepID=UPI0035B45CE9